MAEGGSARADARKPNHLRPMSLDVGVLARSSGSARFTLGGTTVLCGLHGPRKPKYARMEMADRARLEVLVQPASGTSGPKESESQRFTRQSLETVLNLASAPAQSLEFYCQVLSDDGALPTACLTAACAAALDAGFPMKTFCGGATCAVTHDGRVLVDPTAVEEENARATAHFGFRGDDPGVLAVIMDGMASDDEMTNAARLASRCVGCLPSSLPPRFRGAVS